MNQPTPTRFEIIEHFLPWDLWNFALLVAVIILASLPGCAPVKVPVGTFAITEYETETEPESNPSPATSPESSRENGILQPKDGAGEGVLPVLPEIRQYAVRLKVTSGNVIGYGSGVLVTGGVLTASHVITSEHPPQTSPIIECEASNGEVAYGQTYRCDPGPDLGFVAVTWKTVQPSAKVASNPTVKGDTVRSLGLGDSGSITEATHSVTVTTKWERHEEIELDPPGNQGRSGGGIFNSRGELCGVYTGAVVLPSTTGIATGVEAVRGFLGGTQDDRIGGNDQVYAAWIVCRNNCVPCDVFHGRNGVGSDRLKLRYLNVDQPKPANVPDDIWQAAVAGAAVRATPFAMWRTRIPVGGQPVGFPTATVCGGMSTEQLLPWVEASGEAVSE